MHFSWFPVFIAFLSILLIWVLAQWCRKQDDVKHVIMEEDEAFVDDIKTAFNPDVLHKCFSSQSCGKVVGQGTALLQKRDEVGEREMENRIQQEQLTKIFKLMEKDKGKYGIRSMEDVKRQVERYKK